MYSIIQYTYQNSAVCLLKGQPGPILTTITYGGSSPETTACMDYNASSMPSTPPLHPLHRDRSHGVSETLRCSVRPVAWRTAGLRLAIQALTERWPGHLGLPSSWCCGKPNPPSINQLEMLNPEYRWPRHNGKIQLTSRKLGTAGSGFFFHRWYASFGVWTSSNPPRLETAEKVPEARRQ